MAFKHKTILSIFFMLTLFFSCSGGKMSEEVVKFPSIKDIPAAKWKKLSQKKIYFGHQSVGSPHHLIDGTESKLRHQQETAREAALLMDEKELW